MVGTKVHLISLFSFLHTSSVLVEKIPGICIGFQTSDKFQDQLIRNLKFIGYRMSRLHTEILQWAIFLCCYLASLLLHDLHSWFMVVFVFFYLLISTPSKFELLRSCSCSPKTQTYSFLETIKFFC